MNFSSPLRIEQIPATDFWVVTESFSYGPHRVRAGFRTDLASIPRPLWSLVGHPAGRYCQAAVLHDDLYRFCRVSRREADAIFYSGMVALGVSALQRWALWAGVRVGGWVAWNRYRKQQEAIC